MDENKEFTLAGARVLQCHEGETPQEALRGAQAVNIRSYVHDPLKREVCNRPVGAVEASRGINLYE